MTNQKAEISSLSTAIPESRRLKAVLDHTPVIIWQMDATGRIVLSDGRGLERLGLKPGESVGQNVFELYRDMPHVLQAVNLTLSGVEQQILIEVNGVHLESWMSPIRGDEGAITGILGVVNDVTLQIQAQQSDRSSSERFLKAFHVSPSGIAIVELATGRILDVNEAFERLLGQDRRALTGQPLHSFGYWANVAGDTAAIPLHHDGEQPTRRTFYINSTNQKPLPVRIVIEEVDLDQQPCALLIVRDARRYIKMRRALKQSRKRYRDLLSLAPVGIFQADLTGRIIHCNQQCLQFFDLEHFTVRHKGWWERIDESARGPVQQLWQQAITTRTSLTTEFPVVGQSHARWLQLQLTPERSQASFIGSLTDITERKQIELELQSVNERLEANVRMRTDLLARASKTLEEQIFERRRTYQDLEQSEERWRSLVEHAPDVILLINRQGAISYINHMRFRPELNVAHVIDRTVFEFACPEFHDLMRTGIAQVFDEGISISQEVQAPDDFGNRRWFQSHLAPIYHGDRVIGATAIVRDITEARSAAEELRQTQDLLTHTGRVQMVGEMTAGFAHELGQPLSAIATYIDACQIRLKREGTTNRDILDAMQIASSEAQRAMEVVRRLRDFLQRNELQRRPEDLNRVVQEAVRLAESTLRKYEIELDLTLTPELPEIEVDAIQVMQVLLNLILNSAEAMTEVQCPRRCIQIRTSCPLADIVEIEVTDSGPGIPPGHKNEIFEAFFTTKKAGLGLGLAISRRIVEAHGGQIHADLEKSFQGARFLVRFPVELALPSGPGGG